VEARQIGAPGSATADAAPILPPSRIPFGDDPSEGLVHAPRFGHPQARLPPSPRRKASCGERMAALIGGRRRRRPGPGSTASMSTPRPAPIDDSALGPGSNGLTDGLGRRRKIDDCRAHRRWRRASSGTAFAARLRNGACRHSSIAHFAARARRRPSMALSRSINSSIA